MKQFILFLLVLLPVCAFAQFTETFDGPVLSTEWLGARDSFLLVNGQLQLNATKGYGGVAALKRLITYTPNMQWEFEIQMKTVPSEKNYMRIYLYMENAETYYYVQIGCKKEKNDKVEKKIGLRRNGGVDMFDRKESSLDSKTHLSIKVTLEDNKYWKMYSRNINDKYYKEEGSCTYPIANAPVSGYFIINMIYTGSRNKHFLMDNIRISDEITPTITDSDETPVDPDDPDVPSVEMPFPDVEIVSLSELQFNFESPVDISNANSFISGIGKADYLKYGDTKAVVNAGFPKDMTPGESYIISFTGLTDLSGKSLNLASEEFKLEDEGNDPVIPSGTILINEIMAKPGDGPFFEYIELYNTSRSSVALKGLELWCGTRCFVLPDIDLQTNKYALLCKSGSEIDFDLDGIVIPVSMYYPLRDEGQSLMLKDPSGTIIDQYEYPKATPAKSWERSASGDWHLSSDPRGGTPGSVNSSGKEEEPTEPEEPVEPDDPDKPDDSEDPDDPDKPDDSEDDPSVIVEPSEFIINELLPNPFAGGSEYIELYNRSDRSLPLSGLSVAVRKADGTLNTRYPLSSVASMIEPDGYVLLTKNKSGVTDFYTILSPLSLFEIPKLPILANTSSTLVLFRTKDETVIDEVSYSSKWHASSIKDQKGVALERIDPEAETQSAANWTSASATAGYGTPGYQNSQSKIPNPDEPDQPTGVEAPEWVPGSNHYSITYYLDQPGYNCRAFVFNTAGQRVAEIANHELLGLSGQLTWDGSSSAGRKLPTGVYIFYAEVYHSGGTVKRYKQVFLIR